MTTGRPLLRGRAPVTRPSRNGSALVAGHGEAGRVFTLTLDAPAVGAARLRLAGHLDGEAAHDVLHAAADVVRSGCSRLVLDLDGLVSWDDEATYAVVGCTRLARWLPEGVTVVAGGAPQRALVPSGPDVARSSGPHARAAGTAADTAADTMAACHAC